MLTACAEFHVLGLVWKKRGARFGDGYVWCSGLHSLRQRDKERKQILCLLLNRPGLYGRFGFGPFLPTFKISLQFVFSSSSFADCARDSFQ